MGEFSANPVMRSHAAHERAEANFAPLAGQNHSLGVALAQRFDRVGR